MPPMDDDKLREILTALLEEMRNSKVQISDVLAQRSEYAADIRDLKTAIDTTRRALDPEALGSHVADNNNAFMGQSVQAFAKAIQISLNAAEQNAASQTGQAAQNIKDHADKITALKKESRTLANIAANLEERDQRSKWDWAVLGCGMIIAAGLAGASAFYYAQDTIREQDFNRSVQLITQDDAAGWCRIADGQNIQGASGAWFCAVPMSKYQEPAPAE